LYCFVWVVKKKRKKNEKGIWGKHWTKKKRIIIVIFFLKRIFLPTFFENIREWMRENENKCVEKITSWGRNRFFLKKRKKKKEWVLENENERRRSSQ
jgi:hypothetical protein